MIIVVRAVVQFDVVPAAAAGKYCVLYIYIYMGGEEKKTKDKRRKKLNKERSTEEAK